MKRPWGSPVKYAIEDLRGFNLPKYSLWWICCLDPP